MRVSQWSQVKLYFEWPWFLSMSELQKLFLRIVFRNITHSLLYVLCVIFLRLLPDFLKATTAPQNSFLVIYSTLFYTLIVLGQFSVLFGLFALVIPGKASTEILCEDYVLQSDKGSSVRAAAPEDENYSSSIIWQL